MEILRFHPHGDPSVVHTLTVQDKEHYIRNASAIGNEVDRIWNAYMLTCCMHRSNVPKTRYIQVRCKVLQKIQFSLYKDLWQLTNAKRMH